MSPFFESKLLSIWQDFRSNIVADTMWTLIFAVGITPLLVWLM